MKTLFLVLSVIALSTVLMAQNNQHFFGQTPPGSSPVRFAAEIIDNHFYPHSRLIIPNDGNKLYWTSFVNPESSDKVLYYSDFDGEQLSMPNEESDLAELGILSFIFSNDDDHIMFGSLQPYDEWDGTPVRAVWTFEKSESGWSAPQAIESTVDANWASLGSVSINNKGYIYFTGRKEGESAKIYCSKYINGSYQKYEALPEIINTGITLDPFIDFQDEYLLFAAANRADNNGIIDLYISFKDEYGHFSRPINLGQEICTPNIERFPSVTRDGKYLFFVTSHSDHFPSTYTHYYWVDTQIIDSLSSLSGTSIHPEASFNHFNQNFPNPFSVNTTFTYHLSQSQNVIIRIFGLLGQEIVTLVNEKQPSGDHEIIWSRTDQSGKLVDPGIYLAMMQMDGVVSSTHKIIAK